MRVTTKTLSIIGILAFGTIAGIFLIQFFMEARADREQLELFNRCLEAGGRLVDTVDPRQCQFPSGVVVDEP